MAANTYLLTAATVAGIAIGSIGTASLTARASTPDTKTLEATISAPAATVAGLTVTQVAVQACAVLNAQYELSGADACTLAKTQQVTIYKKSDEPGQLTVSIRAEIPGTWSPGDPE